ncbi:MAG TPA: VOC family protein [Candidatus Saccharimonadales bacterium]|nr:VOC family protein [Candidatus Saccharimonadales bacterium]
MGNRVVHFEIEAKDVARAKKFYTDAFGWKMEQMDAKYGDYVVVTTGDPKEAGGINGGIYTTPGKKKEVNAFRCVVAVDDIEKAAEDVEKAGGKILTKNKKADNIPGVGLFLSCEDPEKNRFTLLQPSGDMEK